MLSSCGRGRSQARTMLSLAFGVARGSAPVLSGRSSAPLHFVAPALLRASALRMQSSGPDRTVVEKCTAKIEAAIDCKELKIEGAYDDPNGSHITIYCVSEAFEGKRSLARQQMVFKAIWEEMQVRAFLLIQVSETPTCV